MCLAIPGKVIEITQQHGQPVGRVDFDGTTLDIALAYVPEAQLGDYVIAHAGVAIQILDESAAAESLRLFDALGADPAGEP